VEWNSGLDPLDDKLLHSALHLDDALLTCLSAADDLGQQSVIVWRSISCVDVCVHAYTVSLRSVQRGDTAGRWSEVIQRVLCIDTALDGVISAGNTSARR
jgi:hypothetical protein